MILLQNSESGIYSSIVSTFVRNKLIFHFICILIGTRTRFVVNVYTKIYRVPTCNRSGPSWLLYNNNYIFAISLILFVKYFCCTWYWLRMVLYSEHWKGAGEWLIIQNIYSKEVSARVTKSIKSTQWVLPLVAADLMVVDLSSSKEQLRNLLIVKSYTFTILIGI